MLLTARNTQERLGDSEDCDPVALMMKLVTATICQAGLRLELATVPAPEEDEEAAAVNNDATQLQDQYMRRR